MSLFYLSLKVAKPRKFSIKESVLELKKLREKEFIYSIEKRLIWLISVLKF